MDRPTAPLPKKYLTIAEAQAYTTLGKTKLLEARDMRKLKFRNIEGRVVFEIKHLDEFMESYELINSKPTYKRK